LELTFTSFEAPTLLVRADLGGICSLYQILEKKKLED
jgi:hypothetical protein